MVFSSTVFVFFFLPLCLMFTLAEPDIRVKNIILLLFSLVFYAWGEPVYVILMVLSILLNYTLGRFMAAIPEWRKGILVLGLVMNLGILGFFKYYGFAVDILNRTFGLQLTAHDLPLPIGISFYTFQALSYVIDLYRGNVRLQKNVLDFGLYITMFPQLIAGPIVRYSDVQEQLADRHVTAAGLGRGMARFLFGLAKKVLLANRLGAVFDASGVLTGPTGTLTAWVGLLAYSLQIYFDFSGYSDMAIGMGEMLGFDFPENFNAPYGSASVTDFWRRWHMTLGTWFREYVYIPLGGNRVKPARHIANILIVWGLTGLWHGAAANFVLWGLYYGLLLLFEKFVWFRWEKRPAWLCHALTLLAVFFGWGLFCCGSLAECGQTFSNLFGQAHLGFVDGHSLHLLLSHGALLVAGAALSLPWAVRLRQALMDRHLMFLVVLCAALFVVCTAFLVTQNYNPFLYFRF